ncbi:MAG: hypothetical protein PHN37_01270 [Candidatus Pacebacteria bacterium]|nr:hypothetical protein [Candidatus Paceibacterota bacterium]
MSFLPDIIFYFSVLVVLVLFLWIIKILFFTPGINLSKIKRFIVLFLIIIVGISSSFLVSLWLERGEVMKPNIIFKIEQPSLLTQFPSSPSFVKIDDYYFSGPFSINQKYRESPVSLWTAFCENDIIGIGVFSVNDPDFTQEQKNCFSQICSNSFYATLPFFKQEEISQLEKIANYLIIKFNPQCNFYE